ncbi:MAG: sigma-70 family RNA polymerase sigma factor [Psychrilyobacter sp.]|nr:sigma-70 family RNA polymerase sigma factor [Psychrilyobacter sp.]
MNRARFEVTEEILLEAKGGDQEAVGMVVENYKGFVRMNAKNYFLLGAERDDLIQEGMIGLLKAIRAYDTDKAASFKTFATICVKRQIITAIKKANSNKNKALNTSIGIENENKETNREREYLRGLKSYQTYNPEELTLSKEQTHGLRDYLEKKLSPLETTVFRYMVKGYSYKEIAEIMDEKVKAVDNAIQRIKRKSEMWLSTYKGLS